MELLDDQVVHQIKAISGADGSPIFGQRPAVTIRASAFRHCGQCGAGAAADEPQAGQ